MSWDMSGSGPSELSVLYVTSRAASAELKTQVLITRDCKGYLPNI